MRLLSNEFDSKLRVARSIRAGGVLLTLLAALASLSAQSGGGEAPYRNPKLPVDERVTDLLRRMTPEEKIGQLECEVQEVEGKDTIITKGLGNLGVLLRELSASDAATKANRIQKLALEKTRLGIPIIIHDEALHGLMGAGATSFPQAIGLAAAFDPVLVEEIAHVIGRQARSRGIRQVLSPVVNIARDARWGRVEETYGEDPFLSARIGAAFCRAIESEGVITTPKHFVANVGDGGRDSHANHFSERLLREVYFPPFKACFQEAHAGSLMAAYNSLDGLPCSSNHWLLTEVLRNEWSFDGFVVSDYGSVWAIKNMHQAAGTEEEGAKKALTAGLDVELPNIDFYGKPLHDAVTDGSVPDSVLDLGVRRLLRAKFRLGMFDDPYVDPARAGKMNDTREDRNLALRAARESIVLLKNENNLLPLDKNIKSIAVLGPNADAVRLGGYSGRGMKVVTVKEGISSKVSPKTAAGFAQGCVIGGTGLPAIPSTCLVAPESRAHGLREERADTAIDRAVALARRSEAAVIVVGIVEGEGSDRADLDLPGKQERLIKAVAATGVPTIVVLLCGSPVTMRGWLDGASAVLDAWYGGEEGGNAIADVLFGDANPGGRLPITFPRSVGQVPLYYEMEPSGRGYDYADMSGTPLYPFGYGLSYTNFEYRNLTITPSNMNEVDTVSFRFDLRNAGSRKGEEVVQCYLHDSARSVIRPLKELKAFRRITLEPGESKSVTFTLSKKELEFYDQEMRLVVEPGMTRVLIGSSSADIRLEGEFTVGAGR